MIVVTKTAFVLAVIEVKTSPVLITTIYRRVVTRKILINITASTLDIIIVRHEVTELARVSTLHQSRAGAGLEALKNISSSPDLVLSWYLTLHW